MTYSVGAELGLGRPRFTFALQGDLEWIAFFLWTSVFLSLRWELSAYVIFLQLKMLEEMPCFVLNNRRESISAVSRLGKFLTGSLKFLEGHIPLDEGEISMRSAAERAGKRQCWGDNHPNGKVPLGLYPGDLILFLPVPESRIRIVGWNKFSLMLESRWVSSLSCCASLCFWYSKRHLWATPPLQWWVLQ